MLLFFVCLLFQPVVTSCDGGFGGAGEWLEFSTGRVHAVDGAIVEEPRPRTRHDGNGADDVVSACVSLVGGY